MTRYEDLIMNMLPGDFPKEKYEKLLEIKTTLRQIAFPRRGLQEELWTAEEIAREAAKHVHFDSDEDNQSFKPTVKSTLA